MLDLNAAAAAATRPTAADSAGCCSDLYHQHYATDNDKIRTRTGELLLASLCLFHAGITELAPFKSSECPANELRMADIAAFPAAA